jgi:glycosyltransferase involved in cell wall biosynthesis
MPRRVLLLLSQMPQDPSSGAARNLLSICEALATSDFEVRALGTTAAEIRGGFDPEAVLHAAGLGVARSASVGGPGTIAVEARGVRTTLLDVGASGPEGWEAAHGEAFDRLLRALADDWPPDIVVTFGGSPRERARRRFLRTRGAAIVFGLQNLSYLTPAAWADVDAVFTAGPFVTDTYRERIGLRSTPLVAPLDLADVVAERHERRFLTFINPNLAKGAAVFARLAEELSARRPATPILVIEARGDASVLAEAARLGGFDLRGRSNIQVSPSVSQPRTIYQATRVLVVPSVWDEPFGRVAPEALLNGIPPVVSDRGGLAGAAAGGGVVLPIPPDVTPKTRAAPPAGAIGPWIDTCERLMTDDVFYAEACARAREAGERYRPERLRREILTFFARVFRAPGPTAGPLAPSTGP